LQIQNLRIGLCAQIDNIEFHSICINHRYSISQNTPKINFRCKTNNVLKRN
jgi:hypothetical protein